MLQAMIDRLKIRSSTARVQGEDALKHIQQTMAEGQAPSVQSVAGALRIGPDQAASILAGLEQRELVIFQSGSLRLTGAGETYATHLIRAHRLWEQFLAQTSGVPASQWHAQADRAEHRLTPAEVEALAAQLGHPTHDPHGDPIPPAEGTVRPHGGLSLVDLPVDQSARVVHIEDEPAMVYAELVLLGFYPGIVVRLIARAPHELRLWMDGEEVTLTSLLAHSIAVTPLPEAPAQPTERLSVLRPGQKAHITGLSPACRGAERRRLLDLGFVPGTLIEAEMVSPSGDPTAYAIRGALIALRREQTRHIHIVRCEESAT